ncbi:hypothetical protein BA6E_10242 [Bacteroidales bacterium 6E]|nr:hypothetical protein BA6E_10242 [Bacteroidales bacterium 6E]
MLLASLNTMGFKVSEVAISVKQISLKKSIFLPHNLTLQG